MSTALLLVFRAECSVSISKIVVSEPWKPQAIQEKQMQPRTVSVYCGFWFDGIKGTFFLKDDASDAVTVNDINYPNILQEFL